MGRLDCSRCDGYRGSQWDIGMCHAEDACEQESTKEENCGESGNERGELLQPSRACES